MGACCCKASNVDTDVKTRKNKKKRKEQTTSDIIRSENSKEGCERANIDDLEEELESIKNDPEDEEAKIPHVSDGNEEFQVDCSSRKERKTQIFDQSQEAGKRLYSYSLMTKNGDRDAVKKMEVSKSQTAQRRKNRGFNREYWNEIAKHKNIGLFHVDEVYDGLPLYPYAQDPVDPSGYKRNVRIHRPTYSKFLNTEWEKDCPVETYSDWKRMNVKLTAKERGACQRSGSSRTMTVDTNGFIKETGQISVAGWFQTDGVYIEPENPHDSWTMWMFGRYD